MAEIINLRQARKQKARAEKEARAEQNRITFGRTKAEKDLTRAERDLARRRLDSHKRDENEKP
ncbi:DUF4169 domain-containing protein [Microvirga sp. KLBC 81]|uniref:DUF4169 family protein n=1 Tax=Microvirga sp. KLBC 81 TaxID=1862707 RepID=UPI000D50ABD1|nr:DUF4169 family protein [Microvirga sp. KLBC 81]PVE25360.1 DUF4169 domain-containing protein [Microvirga sp. KLBC 81]